MFMVETGLNFSFPVLTLSGFEIKLYWPYKICSWLLVPSFFLFSGTVSVRPKLFAPRMFIRNHQYNSLGLQFVGKKFIIDSFFFKLSFSYLASFAKFHFFLGIYSFSLNFLMYCQRHLYLFTICRTCSYKPFIIPKITHRAFFLFLF